MKTNTKLIFIICFISSTYGNSISKNSSAISSVRAQDKPQPTGFNHSPITNPEASLKKAPAPEVSEYEIPVTRPSNSLISTALLNGLFIEKSKQGLTQHLTLMLTFTEESEFGTSIITEKNPVLNMWTFDIYNSHLGGAITEVIEEKPVTNSEFEEIKVNLNHGVEGLAPDWRDVLRFKIATETKVDCKVTRDDFNKIIIDLSWKEDQEPFISPEESTWVSKLTFWK